VARAALGLLQLGEARRAEPPGAAVEIPQHRAAPVEEAPARRLAFELDAEGDGVGERKARDVARRHRVREAGERAVGVLRQPPERPLDARKEQEEQGGGRQRLRKQHPCGAQVGARVTERRGEADEGGDARRHRQAHAGGRGDRLGVEEVGDRDEPGEEHHRRAVALVARF
jgi:hypothetical protein